MSIRLFFFFSGWMEGGQGRCFWRVHVLFAWAVAGLRDEALEEPADWGEDESEEAECQAEVDEEAV